MPLAVLQELKEEHRLIERAVALLEREAERLDQGESPSPAVIDALVLFFQGFADKRHHHKEEQFLFPALASKKDIIRDGPVKVLTGEHEAGRYFTKELREGSEDLRQGHPNAQTRLRRALALYAQMLRRHIAKEEEIVFLLAEVLLSEEEGRAMAEAFRQENSASQADYDLLLGRLENA